MSAICVQNGYLHTHADSQNAQLESRIFSTPVETSRNIMTDTIVRFPVLNPLVSHDAIPCNYTIENVKQATSELYKTFHHEELCQSTFPNITPKLFNQSTKAKMNNV
jgi:hypothetical protein